MRDPAFAIFVDAFEPLVLCATTGHDATNASFAAYLTGLEARLGRGQPFAYMFDARRGPFDMGASFRKRQAEWLAETRAQFEPHHRGSAFLLEGRFQRGVLQAIFWLTPPYYAYSVESDAAAAYRWARARLGPNGSALPDEQRFVADYARALATALAPSGADMPVSRPE